MNVDWIQVGERILIAAGVLGLVMFAIRYSVTSVLEDRLKRPGVIDEILLERLERPEYMAKILREVRPTVIFDSSGAKLVDQGAADLIELKIVEQSDKSTIEILEVTTTEHLNLPPIIEVLDGGAVVVVPTRLPGNVWRFEFISRSRGIEWHGPAEAPPPARYRLELIPNG